MFARNTRQNLRKLLVTVWIRIIRRFKKECLLDKICGSYLFMIRIIMGIYSMYKNKHEWLPESVHSEKNIQVEVL